MKELIDVIMLPTEDSTDVIVRHKGINQGIPHFREYYGAAMLDMGDKYQHLYVTVSHEVEAIKECDWIYDLYGNISVYQLLKKRPNWTPNGKFKIIATTDPNLITVLENHNDFDRNVKSPQLQKSFIQAYCANPDGEYEVEYDVTHCDRSKDGTCCELINCAGWITNNQTQPNDQDCDHRFKLQLNQDNTVNITPTEKKLYSRKDMEDFGVWLGVNYSRNRNTLINILFDNWITNNI